MPENNLEKQTFEAAVIGGGAAGLSCAAWCAELGISAVLFEQENEFGGQMLWTHNEIRNYLGAEVKNGREMRDIFVRQTAESAFVRRLQTKVTRADCTAKRIETICGSIFDVKFIVLASGIRRRRLGIGEENFLGKGLIESGKRDGEKAAGKTAVIIGGGDAAAENALMLAKTARKVFLVHRRREFRARREFLDQIFSADSRIEVLTDARPTSLHGANHLESVEITFADDAKRRLDAEILLIRIGVEPNSDLIKHQVETDENGYVAVDFRSETSSAGVFAIGDVANPTALTISTAVGTGAACAKVMREILDKNS